MGHPRPLFVYFWSFSLKQFNVKIVNPVYSVGIQTHDLQNMSLIKNHKTRAPAPQKLP